MGKNTAGKTDVTYFPSFEEENKNEYERRKNLTLEERLREFELLQNQQWGADWKQKPMVKIAAFEKLF